MENLQVFLASNALSIPGSKLVGLPSVLSGSGTKWGVEAVSHGCASASSAVGRCFWSIVRQERTKFRASSDTPSQYCAIERSADQMAGSNKASAND